MLYIPESPEGLSGSAAVSHSTRTSLKQLRLLLYRLLVGLPGVKVHLQDLVNVGVEVFLSEFRRDFGVVFERYSGSGGSRRLGGGKRGERKRRLGLGSVGCKNGHLSNIESVFNHSGVTNNYSAYTNVLVKGGLSWRSYCKGMYRPFCQL